MEILFRFNVLREANKSSDEINPIDLTANTQFQNNAAAIPNGSNRKDQLRTLAKNYIASSRFARSIEKVAQYKALDNVSIAIDDLLASEKTSRAEVETALTTALGTSPASFLSGTGLQNRMRNLGDSILAIKLSPDDHDRPIRRLAAVLRAFHLIQTFEIDGGFPADAEALRAEHQRAFRLPGAVLPTKPPTPPRVAPPEIGKIMKGLVDKYKMIDGAVLELSRLTPEKFHVTKLSKDAAKLPPEKLRPTQLFEQEVDIRQASLRARLMSSIGDVTRPPNGNETTLNIGTFPRVNMALSQLGSANLLTEKPGLTLGAGARIALQGHPDFEPVDPRNTGLKLTDKAREQLTSQTVGAAKALKLDLSEPVAETVRRLKTERRAIHEQVQALVQPLTQTTYRMMGSTTVAITKSPYPVLYGMSPGAILDIFGTFVFDPKAGVPSTHADVKPAGIIDLLLVKQQLKGYETSDVSHIANMLKGEKTERIHRTKLETETITFVETEKTVETEKSLETADRFEMKRESEESLAEEVAVKGSLEVKGKYGPTFEFKAAGEASWKRKSEESEKAANEVAREVTQKATEKITERVLRRETLRVNRQVEETNLHAFDNTAGAGHVSGVYQWVTKVYEAQMFNYGPRTVYDFMIPEPGAFLLEVFRRRRTAALELEKPPAFEITPDQLTEDNYQTFVSLYRATDVKPPPEPFATETYDFNTGGEDKDQEFTNSTRIQIPEGYEAMRAHVGAVVAVWDDWNVDVVIGQNLLRYRSGTSRMQDVGLSSETGSVPFAMVTDLVGDIAVGVEVYCQASERAYDLWKAETHAKLINAYEARLSEYEAKLAELESEAPAEIDSGPTARNKALMMDEVKKACISILTEQHFDMFDAVDTDAAGLPQIDFNETASEGAYVRFFEQAFEWEFMSWVPYGYFWGRKSTWLDKVVIEDDDKEFQDFLKAGYIRVQVPIRPGFIDAVDHFRLFGDTWQGGPLPSVSDDTYLPIAEEIAERLGRPGDEVPVGEPWEVRVPTTLVKLRDDDKLPKWEKQPDGSWAEV
jgi:hypothetical protein